MFWEDIETGKLPRLPGGAKAPRVAKLRGPAPESLWTPPAILPRIPAGTLVALDLETKERNMDLYGPAWPMALRFPDDDWGHVCGVSLDWGEGGRYYPLRHVEDVPLDYPITPQNVIDFLQGEVPKWRVVCHNVPYDAGWCLTLGVDLTRAQELHDTFAMSALLDEHARAHGLDAVAKRLGFEGKDEALMNAAGRAFGFEERQVKANLWQLPSRYVGPYAEDDAQQTRYIYEPLRSRISAEDMDRIYTLEQRQWPVLLDMRRRGVRVDEEARDRLEVEWSQTILDQQALLDEMAGHSVSPWAQQSIAHAMDHMGIAYPIENEKPSFVKEWLRGHDHPFVQALAALRSVDKMKGTFLGKYFGKCVVGGRIHGTFHALAEDDSGTISGRYASSKPNLQNIPVRDLVYGPPLRRLVLPEEGYEWLSGDYSQQEPRLMIHYAVLAKAKGAGKAQAQFRANPKTDYHQFMADLCGLPRGQTKGINLGMGYGMGEVALCHHIGVPTKWVQGRNGQLIEVAGDEGKAIFKAYHSHAPFVKELYEMAERKAKRKHKITTYAGRVCHFPPGIEARKAFNRVIQGSAADMIKRAMAALYEAGFLLHITVHDEVGASVMYDDEVLTFKEIMEDAMPLAIPVVADCGVGANWGDAKDH